MVEEQVIRTIADKQNSIEIGTTAKGDLVYTLKIYCNWGEEELVIDKLKKLKESIELDFLNKKQ